jgi:hypothetical protein
MLVGSALDTQAIRERDPGGTRVAILQSSYIPWKGYFDIIHDVDRFVFYDDVQFTPRDWRTRNRIKTAQGPIWLTVPAGQSRSRLICEVMLEDTTWGKKHWDTLRHAYGKTPHFASFKPFLEHVYLERRWSSLSELNQFMTRTIATEFLGIKTEFRDSREFGAQGHKFERLFDLAVKAGATSYLSGPSAQDYIDAERFSQAGIELAYKSYAGYPEYSQLYPPFEHAVTILDLLFHTGPDAPLYIWGWRSEQATSKP